MNLQLKKIITNLCILIYTTFLLFVLGLSISDLWKYILLFVGIGIVYLIFFIFTKKIQWKEKAKPILTEEEKEIKKDKIDSIKKILAFCYYGLIIVGMYFGLANNGEYYDKYISSIYMKRFCNNEIFNWLFIFSCIPYFISPYNIAHAVFDYLYNKYGLLEKKEEK